VLGIRESATSNNAMVILKVAIILFFVAVGLTLIRPANWTTPETGGFAPNGFAGISAGAAIIFFSYIGFDATSTAAEEAIASGASIDEAAAQASEGAEPSSDLAASADFRGHLARVLARRALEEAATR